VISDLKNEVAHQDFHGSTGVGNQLSAGGALHNEDTARLALRVEQMERSINRILPIVRKILYTVSERPAADDEAPSGQRDAAH